MKKAYLNRFGSLIRNFPQSSFQQLASFSSYSAAIPKLPHFSSDEDEGGSGSGSASYRYVLRNQRPTSIRWKPELCNSVSFIGRVDRPLVIYKTKGGSFGAYTCMQVRNPCDPNRTFRMYVEMWGDMAKMGIQHLKQNDNIYVSGNLGSYEIADENGNLKPIYKVNAKELCYVAQHDRSLAFQKTEDSEESQSGANLGENSMEKYKARLDLWQLFFCKPCEWRDKRKSKQNSESPDFKHKYNGENLF